VVTANVRSAREGRMTALRGPTSKGVVAALTGGLLFAAAWGVGPLTAHGATGDAPATGPCTSTISGAHSGNLTLSTPGTTTCLKNANQNGAITVASGAALSVVDSTVTGAITSTSAAPFTFCHSNTVRGAIKVSQSKGFVLIGDGPGGVVSCGVNNVDGAITADSNTGGVEVGGNTTSGAITVTHNVAAASGTPNQVEGNQVGGALTCTGNIPAPTNDSRANTVKGGRTGQTCGSGTF
jgi:hexosaminidase